MPAPARKRSATLARPASESRPILAVVLALGILAAITLALTAFDSDGGRSRAAEAPPPLPVKTSCACCTSCT
ncbi:MAG: hypothetical protein ACO3J6_09140, partial [Opitutales bacterium]